jgi:hypothetical protein
MKRVIRAVLPALIALLLPAVAFADIFQWTDNTGVAHYTNLKALVPADDQASMQVVVDEAARQQQAAGQVAVPEAAASAVPAAPAADPASQAELVQALYDRTQWLTAYLEGLQSGLAVGRDAPGGSVGINAPVVVTGSSAPPNFYGYNTPYYGYGWPYFGYGWPYFYGWPPVYTTFTTGALFHGRRFRHFRPLRKQGFGFGRIGGFTRAPPHARAGWGR